MVSDGFIEVTTSKAIEMSNHGFIYLKHIIIVCQLEFKNKEREKGKTRVSHQLKLPENGIAGI